MIIMQRLGEGKTLWKIIKDVLGKNRSHLPENKRVREDTLSEASGAYSQARKRINLESVEFGTFSRRLF